MEAGAPYAITAASVVVVIGTALPFFVPRHAIPTEQRLFFLAAISSSALSQSTLLGRHPRTRRHPESEQ
jgi:hypothetical protein